MFFVVYLPLAVFFTVIYLMVDYNHRTIKKSDQISSKLTLEMAFSAAFVVFIVGGLISIGLGMVRSAASVVPDTLHPVYLSPLLGEGDTSGKYLVGLGGNQARNYSFYYYDPQTTEKKQEIVSADHSPTIYDSPAKPYYLSYIVTCPPNNFWIIGCTDKNYMEAEFHLPPNSIVK